MDREKGSILAQAIVYAVSVSSLVIIGAGKLDYLANCPNPTLPITDCRELTPKEIDQRQRDAITAGVLAIAGVTSLIGGAYIGEKVEDAVLNR